MYTSTFIGRRSASYTQSTNLAGLTLDQMRRTAPSIFAQAAHESRSDRYAYIPTSHVLERLLAEGFVCTKVQQARTRVEGKQDYTKHLLQFIHRADQGKSDSAASLALLNSHDGSSRYKLLAGRIRYVCLNGLLVSDDTFGEVSVPHTGDIVGRVIEGSFSVIEGAQKAGQVVEAWKGITLQDDEAREFAGAAALLRWDGEGARAPIEATRLLAARRAEDRAPDLWTTFNRVQENLVRGGQAFHTRNDRGQVRRGSVRAVNGIDGNVSLNRALWALTERMAQLKGVTQAAQRTR